MEIQELIVNPKSRPVKLNSKQYQFLLSTFPAKINDKIFQINEKTLFYGSFVQGGFFLKTLAKCNCSGPQQSDAKDTE